MLFVFLFILTAFFYAFPTIIFADSLPECDPNSVLGLTPVMPSDPDEARDYQGATNPGACQLYAPVTTVCWTKHPPANINYDCYEIPARPLIIPTPTTNPGTCTWSLGPRRRRVDNKCNTGFAPDAGGSTLNPQCTCRPIGTGGTFLNTPTPRPTAQSPTPIPPPPPCTRLDLKTGNCLEVDTAIGPIQTDPKEFVKKIFGIVLSLSGGIAVLLIIVSGYKLMVSQGNQEKTQAAREMLTSAIVGLLFIIFSLVILQIIGVDILKLPGFQ